MFLDIFVSLRIEIQHRDWLISDFDKLSVHIIISKVATKTTKIKFVTSKLVERKKWNEGVKNQFKRRQEKKKN